MEQSLAGKSVLIVDDEPEILRLLEWEFTDHQAEVTLANGGEEALALLKEKHFDIVLSDLKMPNGDGVWLMTQIQKELTQIPCLFLCSGYNTYSTQELQELGVQKVFPKPFELDEIVVGILQCCDFSSC